jgi:small redox-active disulfide protein 2
MTTHIRVLGPGCYRCQELYEHTTEAVAELGLDADVQKVVDLTEIARRGILATPALVVDEELVLTGQVPTKKQIEELLSSLA